MTSSDLDLVPRGKLANRRRVRPPAPIRKLQHVHLMDRLVDQRAAAFHRPRALDRRANNNLPSATTSHERRPGGSCRAGRRRMALL